MLLNDAYAGYRKWWDPEWKENPALASVYTEWDFVLVRVYQYMQDYTTENGQPIWVEEDPDVQWEMETRGSFLSKEIHDYRETHNLKPWQFPTAKPVWEDNVEPPSMRKWLKRLDDEAQGRDTDKPVRGRPPTVEELAAMQASG